LLRVVGVVVEIVVQELEPAAAVLVVIKHLLMPLLYPLLLDKPIV